MSGKAWSLAEKHYFQCLWQGSSCSFCHHKTWKPGFESSHQQILLSIYLMLTVENKEKDTIQEIFFATWSWVHFFKYKKFNQEFCVREIWFEKSLGGHDETCWVHLKVGPHDEFGHSHRDSATRFGKNSPLWQNLQSVQPFSEGFIFSICHNFVHTYLGTWLVLDKYSLL